MRLKIFLFPSSKKWIINIFQLPCLHIHKERFKNQLINKYPTLENFLFHIALFHCCLLCETKQTNIQPTSESCRSVIRIYFWLWPLKSTISPSLQKTEIHTQSQWYLKKYIYHTQGLLSQPFPQHLSAGLTSTWAGSILSPHPVSALLQQQAHQRSVDMLVAEGYTTCSGNLHFHSITSSHPPPSRIRCQILQQLTCI